MPLVSRPVKRLLATLFLFVAACESPTRPTVYVPESWKDYRQGVGHVAHLEADVACADCHPAEGSGFASPGALICDDCHETKLDRTHASDGAPKSACLECHAFETVTEVRPDGCLRCHDGAKAAAPKVHEKDCTACHQPHATKPRERCEKCHEEVQANLHVTIRDPIEKCAACHEPHGGARDCASCHEGKSAKGHDGCVSCHVPHEAPKTCATCHDKVSKIGHEACVTCHDPHAVERDPRETCASCHADVLVDHADKTACADCHGGHAKPTFACTKCHENAPSDRALHAGRTDCKSCHVPHQMVTAPTPDACSRCHAEVGARALAEHAECVTCHGAAHAPKRSVEACAKCHEVGGHDACNDCHEPHSGRAAKKACVTCHDTKPPHGTVEDCARCHDQHASASPPSCKSCHATLPALHGNSGHTNCIDCHKAHGPRPTSTRRTCGRCHEGLESHEPNAASCRGCHPFAAPNEIR